MEGKSPILKKTGLKSRCFILLLFAIVKVVLSESAHGGPLNSVKPVKTSKPLKSGDLTAKYKKPAMDTCEKANDPQSSTQFFENFSFKDIELKIKQDTFVGHNAVLWDAARVLAKYFEFSSLDWRGKKVLDLGSGCGLIGICLATLDAQVTVTELPGRTTLLEENVMTNVPDKGVSVKECVWGEVGTTTAWGQVDDMGNDWDFITGTDLVYSDDSTPALVQHIILPATAVQTLLRTCGPQTECLLSLELRRQKDLEFFDRLRSHGFSFRRLSQEELHPVFQADEIAVFRIRPPAPPATTAATAPEAADVVDKGVGAAGV